jgi:hypothetical protein
MKEERKDFNIKEIERWIQTRLRQLVIKENADFQLLQIGKSVNKEKLPQQP